jgi:hypothetical protein
MNRFVDRNRNVADGAHTLTSQGFDGFAAGTWRETPAVTGLLAQ